MWHKSSWFLHLLVLSFCMSFTRVKCIWLSRPLYFCQVRKTIWQFKKRKEHNTFINTSRWRRNKAQQLHYISSVTAEKFAGGNDRGVWWTKYCISLWISAWVCLHSTFWKKHSKRNSAADVAALWFIFVRNSEYDKLQRHKNWNVLYCNFWQFVLPLKCWQILMADWALLHFWEVTISYT